MAVTDSDLRRNFRGTLAGIVDETVDAGLAEGVDSMVDAKIAAVVPGAVSTAMATSADAMIAAEIAETVTPALAEKVASTQVDDIKCMLEADYTALGTKVDGTLYLLY